MKQSSLTKIVNQVKNIEVKQLKNNTQKVLVSLLRRPGEWIPRSLLKTASPGSRIRDLRTEKFGGFRIETATPEKLNRRTTHSNQTWYRLDPMSIDKQKVEKVLSIKL